MRASQERRLGDGETVKDRAVPESEREPEQLQQVSPSGEASLLFPSATSTTLMRDDNVAAFEGCCSARGRAACG